MCVLEGAWRALPRFGQGQKVEVYEVLDAKVKESKA
jgi:hypothetical protein